MKAPGELPPGAAEALAPLIRAARRLAQRRVLELEEQRASQQPPADSVAASEDACQAIAEKQVTG